MNRPALSNPVGRPRLARLDRDRKLVEAARRDPVEFDALYRKYLAQVYSYAFYELHDHHAAEDVTERTFLQALAGLPRFEERGMHAVPHERDTAGASADGASADGASAEGASAEGASAEGLSTFRVWLFRIARNVVANERRRSRRRPEEPLEAADGIAGPDDVVEIAAAREAGSEAWQAVARLPEDRRRAVVLRFVDEMSTAEIAAILGRSEGAVRVLLHRSLRAVGADLRRRLS